MRKLHLSWAIDLVTNIFHVDVDDIGRWIRRHIPNLLQQGGACYGAPWSSHHELKDREFTWSEIDPPPIALYATLIPMQDEVPNSRRSSRHVTIATQQRLHSCLAFQPGKGFDEIIIRATFESLHLILYPTATRQHENRKARLAVLYLPEHINPIQRGEIDIQDDQIIALFALCQLEAGLTILHVMYDELRAKFFRKEAGKWLVVLDNQDSFSGPLAEACGQLLRRAIPSRQFFHLVKLSSCCGQLSLYVGLGTMNPVVSGSSSRKPLKASNLSMGATVVTRK